MSGSDDDWELLTKELLQEEDEDHVTLDALHSETADATSATAATCDAKGKGRGEGNACSDHSPSPPRTSPPPATNFKTSSWWAQLLKQHVKDMGCPDPNPEMIRTKSLVSVCSGICAEAEVLRVTQIFVLAVYLSKTNV